ncbi:hypothetical protein PSHT_03302 [Puccinia striiformis]|uniref:Uncharacterized protein n=1 Tax=Puccinia striiformis TaxID=27350 RepID=A0A2S4WFZ1_9BASI|nr:hypothetical protein PSHT_03302 [Puccinia striiformis]
MMLGDPTCWTIPVVIRTAFLVFLKSRQRKFKRLQRVIENFKLQAGVSNKRSFSDYLWEARTQSSSHDWLKNRPPPQGIITDQERQNRLESEPQLHLGLSLHRPETARKKAKVKSAAAETAADGMGHSTFPEKPYWSTPGSSLLLESVRSPCHDGQQSEPWTCRIGSGRYFDPRLDLSLGLGQNSEPRKDPMASGSMEKQHVTGTALEIEVEKNSGRNFPEEDYDNRPIPVGASQATIVPPSSEPTSDAPEQSYEKALVKLEYNAPFSMRASTSEEKILDLPSHKAAEIVTPKTKKRGRLENTGKSSAPQKMENVAGSSSNGKATTSALRKLFHSPYTEKIKESTGGKNFGIRGPARIKMTEIIHHEEHPQAKDGSYRNPCERLGVCKPSVLTNLRVLQGFGTLSKKGYLKEHDLLHEWLLNILTEFRDQPPDLGAQSSPKVFPGLHLKQVVERVVQAIGSKNSNHLIYRIVKKQQFDNTFVGVVSESHLLMTKTITTLLAAYYKLHNLEKWNCLFRDEGTFLSHLSKLQSPHYKRNTEAIEERKEFIEVLKLLPWKEKCTHNRKTLSKSVQMSMRVLISHKWEDWVDPFVERSPAVVGEAAWARVSLIERGEKKFS